MTSEAISTVKEMLTSQTDLDIILGLLSDHYGIDVLVMPYGVDRLAVVTLANFILDAKTYPTPSRALARIVLDLMTDHRAPEGA